MLTAETDVVKHLLQKESQEMTHGCSQESVGRGKSSLKEGDLQIRSDIEIEVSP